MSVLWTVVTYIFVFGVLGLFGFAVYRLLTAGRADGWREARR